MFFKKNLTTAAICAALSVAAFSAMATDSTDTELTIIGEYTPGACTPVVTGSGIVDYGKHHNSALNPTGKSNKLVQLGRKNSTLNITCTAPTLIAVTSKDNRQSTIVALNDTSYIEKAYDTLVDMKGTKNAFGLGSAPNGQKIGAASIGIDRSNGGIHAADDTGEIPVDLIQTDHWSAATPTWKASSNGAFCSLTSCSAIERGYSVAKTGELTPVAITAVTFPLLIDAAVNDNTILGSDETIKLDGNVTISVQYL
ncbi:DUF1120 domain-containing protein [Escherichia coli]|uniref:DUF1120 domain-containing protein n=1 Tax=Escherichia coli TaxID=562 RepID=UPI002284C3CC|nr:DUF1120 domain-containing protein [Escherichia coli]MCZ0544889.1 DUF1120 domain-containing protein [Escherichia coli]